MKFFYYFAYGSNLLKQRIGVQIKGAEFVSTGLLRNFKLSFVAESKRWKGALATILQDNNEMVWGCVWKVPEEYAAELDKQEALYHRLSVPIECDGHVVECRTYQFSDLSAPKTNPSPHYKTVIVSGAIEHGLPEQYLKKLREITDNGYKGRVEVDIEVIRHLNVDI